MRKPQAVYNGRAKFASKGCKCFICGKWLAKGKRKANQFLCCKKDSRDLSKCQKKYYKDKRAAIAKLKPKPDYGYVICDICGSKVKKTDSMQKRCTSGKKDVLSECQKEGMRRNTRKTPEGKEQRYPKAGTEKRECLKCERKFDSVSPYNRICGECTNENMELRLPEHRVHTPDDGGCSGGRRRIGRYVDDVDVQDVYYGGQ